MNAWVSFAVGAWVGAMFGFFIAALLSAAKNTDRS